MTRSQQSKGRSQNGYSTNVTEADLGHPIRKKTQVLQQFLVGTV